jgi:hypothetical protein
MSEETIFREVDEELRGDRLRNFWRRFGPWIIGAAVLVVLAVAANEGWRWWQNGAAARSSDQFYAALDAAGKNDLAAAQKALDEVIASGSGDYPTLARFREAALLAQQGDTQGAVAAYDALANAQSNPHLRELALLFAANLLVDNGDVAAVEQRVGGLGGPDNPMRNAAREAIGLTQYKAGDLDAALQTFTDISNDPLAGSDQDQRMRIYIAQLTAMGAQSAEQKAAATAAATGTAAAAANAAPAAAAAAAPVPSAPAMMQAAPANATPAVAMQAPGSAPTAAEAGAPAAGAAPAIPTMQPAPAGSAPAQPMKSPLPQPGG